MILSTNTYKHSGNLGGSVFVVPLVGIVAGLILALVYAYVTIYSPIAGYVSILFVLGLGFGVGFLMAYGAITSKCRNPTFLKAAGVLTGVFTLYAAWVFFEFVLLKRGGAEITWANLPAMFFSPATIWDIAKSINVEGWYSLSSFTPSGIVLWIFWAIEAAIIIVMITVLTGFSIDDEVFCERCNQWLEADQPLALAIPETEDLQTRASAGEIDALEALAPATDVDFPRLAVEIKECGRCHGFTTYQVKLADQEVDDDGKTKDEVNDLTQVLLVSGTDRDRLKAIPAAPAS